MLDICIKKYITQQSESQIRVYLTCTLPKGICCVYIVRWFRINIPIDPEWISHWSQRKSCICDREGKQSSYCHPARYDCMTRLLTMPLMSKAEKSRKIIYSGLYKSSSVITVCSVHWITQSTIEQFLEMRWKKHIHSSTGTWYQNLSTNADPYPHMEQPSKLLNYSSLFQGGFEISMICYLP